MSLAAGRPFLAIPGPSPLPDQVLRDLSRPSPDIYGSELREVIADVGARLKRMAGASANLAFYIGNGHAAWEAANVNMLGRGEKALVLASGGFGRGWAEAARPLGIDVELQDSGNLPPDLDQLARRLKDDTEGQIKAVLVCQVDTASSVRVDIPAVKAAMGDHPALLAVDAIAAFGCEAMRMDDWGVDVLVSASQKGLMGPPGMAFVWFSDRAAARQSDLVTPYWNWTPRAAAAEVWQYWGGTPPVQLVYGLKAALDLFDGEGLKQALHRHEVLAKATWAAFDAWGADGSGIRLAVADPASRARSVTAATVPQADALRDWCSSVAGLTLGIGLGADDPANALRVAHMGHVNAHQMLGTLAVMAAGMVALGIPHGPGAVDAAVRVIAAASWTCGDFSDTPAQSSMPQLASPCGCD